MSKSAPECNAPNETYLSYIFLMGYHKILNDLYALKRRRNNTK